MWEWDFLRRREVNCHLYWSSLPAVSIISSVFWCILQRGRAWHLQDFKLNNRLRLGLLRSQWIIPNCFIKDLNRVLKYWFSLNLLLFARFLFDYRPLLIHHLARNQCLKDSFSISLKLHSKPNFLLNDSLKHFIKYWLNDQDLINEFCFQSVGCKNL